MNYYYYIKMTKEYTYFFSKLFPLDSSESEFKPFMINQWFIYHSSDDHNMVSMVRDTPFTVPIKDGQKFRYQLVRLELNKDIPSNKQVLEYYPKVKEIIENHHITPSFVHSKGFEILADFIYTADETNPIMNYQGFEIQFKYCIIPGLKHKDSSRDTLEDVDTSDSIEEIEQVYITHPSFKWPK